MNIERNIYNNFYKEKYFDNFFKTNNDFFNDYYKPGSELYKYIKNNKDLYYISLIITIFGYDGEKEQCKGFLFFWNKFNLESIFIKNGKINYDLDDIKDRLISNIKFNTYINKLEPEDNFGSHISRIWENKFSKIGFFKKDDNFICRIPLNFTNKCSIEGKSFQKKLDFKEIYSKKLGEDNILYEINKYTNTGIFVNEMICLLSFFINKDYSTNIDYNFEYFFGRLKAEKETSKINKKKKEVNDPFNWYNNTFFFDYIKILNSINKNIGIIDFKENNNKFLSVEKELFFQNANGDIKKGLNRIMGFKNFDKIENINKRILLLLDYMDNKYKDNDEYKKITDYEKFIYMENSLCFLGKR